MAGGVKAWACDGLAGVCAAVAVAGKGMEVGGVIHDFTQHWHWPQWVWLAIVLGQTIYKCGKHGKQMLQASGDEVGQPERYNGFTAFLSLGISLAILTCGGFFG